MACEKLVDSFDQEAQRELFDLSAAAVKERVAETTWQAFEMSAIQGVPGAEVAEKTRHSNRQRLRCPRPRPTHDRRNDRQAGW